MNTASPMWRNLGWLLRVCLLVLLLTPAVGTIVCLPGCGDDRDDRVRYVDDRNHDRDDDDDDDDDDEEDDDEEDDDDDEDDD